MKALSIFAAVAALCVALPAHAADYTAKLSLDVQEGNPKYVAAEGFAKKVAEATNGSVEIKLFANGLLGGETESAEGMRLGSVEMGIITSSVFASWIPEVQVLDLPFLFRNDEHVVASNALLTDRLKDKFEAQGFHLLGFSINGARQPMSTFPIEKPEDVKGKKMRVLQSPIHIALWNQMGANPVAIPAAEVYNSMQTGVVDYFDNTATNYLTFKFYEVAPHYTDLRHIYAIGAWVVSKTWWDNLPAESQEAISAAAIEAQRDLPPMQAKVDAQSLAEAVKNGATIHEVADKEAWRSLMRPVWDEFIPKIPDAQQTIEAIEAIQ
ncbi:TRAP transporter substrate-binding protein [Roseibium suaedae]|uniref:Tripartite ATP-independent transporter solute receptor, DctP family n=1 Tax=Roseibium suaedae TaxID=735517 RepID=A0A1M7P991_9HYPH|nr:TRAP transporter substrate-binding protein [Roseibium suaedae]SHN12805.1 tripartite ATP-independent transporter solute receptor, DctP family [Roseibium suaedae]